MLAQVVMNPAMQDTARSPAAMPPPPPQVDGENISLEHFIDRIQGSMESITAPITAMFDKAYRRPLGTAEMIRLQAAVGDYTNMLNILSHVSQSVGTAVQSLTKS